MKEEEAKRPCIAWGGETPVAQPVCYSLHVAGPFEGAQAGCNEGSDALELKDTVGTGPILGAQQRVSSSVAVQCRTEAWGKRSVPEAKIDLQQPIGCQAPVCPSAERWGNHR